MQLTPVATRCSVAVWLKITQGHCWNFKNVLRPRMHAENISLICGGQMVLNAPNAVIGRRGKLLVNAFSVRTVIRRAQLHLGRSFIGLVSLWWYGLT